MAIKFVPLGRSSFLLLQNPENNSKHKRFVQTGNLLCYHSLKSSHWHWYSPEKKRCHGEEMWNNMLHLWNSLKSKRSGLLPSSQIYTLFNFFFFSFHFPFITLLSLSVSINISNERFFVSNLPNLHLWSYDS